MADQTLPGAEAPTIIERPLLSSAQAEPVTEALAKAHAIARLMAVAGDCGDHVRAAAMAMVDHLNAARFHLDALTGPAA